MCMTCRPLPLLIAFGVAVAISSAAEPADVMVCFTPAQGCAERIVAALGTARREVRVQAYGFTAAPLLAALAEAKRRGVDVAVLLDSSDAGRHAFGANAMVRAGVPVWIDSPPGIAHNKLIIIDGELVIGGSYNYTAGAERRNAENVTFTASRAVAARFLANWQARRALSLPFAPAAGGKIVPGPRN